MLSLRIWAIALPLLVCVVLTGMAAPVPKGDGKIPFETVAGLLGKSHLSRGHVKFRKLLGTDAIYNQSDAFDDDESDTQEGDEFRLYWVESGVEMSFRRDRVCDAVRLTPKNGMSMTDGKGKLCLPKSAEYAGELPAKLSFADSPADVKKKLGDPDEEKEGINTVGFQLLYSKKYANGTVDFIVYFTKPKATDEGCQVKYLALWLNDD